MARIKRPSEWITLTDWYQPADGYYVAVQSTLLNAYHLTNHASVSRPLGLNALYLGGHVAWNPSDSLGAIYHNSGANQEAWVPERGTFIVSGTGNFYLKTARGDARLSSILYRCRVPVTSS